MCVCGLAGLVGNVTSHTYCFVALAMIIILPAQTITPAGGKPDRRRLTGLLILSSIEMSLDGEIGSAGWIVKAILRKGNPK